MLVALTARNLLYIPLLVWAIWALCRPLAEQRDRRVRVTPQPGDGSGSPFSRSPSAGSASARPSSSRWGSCPNIAADLLPDLWAVAPEEAIAQAGAMIYAYALGVVVGAPTIAVFAARLPAPRPAVRAGDRIHGRHRRVRPGPDLRARGRGALPRRAPARRVLRRRRARRGVADGSRQARAGSRARALRPHDRERRRRSRDHARSVRSSSWRVAYLVVAAIFALTVVAIRLVVPVAAGRPGRDRPPRVGCIRPGAGLARAADRGDRLRRILRGLQLRRAADHAGDGAPRVVRGDLTRRARARHDDRQPDRRPRGRPRGAESPLHQFRGARARRCSGSRSPRTIRSAC